MALIRQRRKLKACTSTINNERTDDVTYFDMIGGRTKFNCHFNTDLQLALPLDKVLVYSIAFSNEYRVHDFKLGLHEPELPVERSVTLVSSIVVERRCCALQVSYVARLQKSKER